MLQSEATYIMIWSVIVMNRIAFGYFHSGSIVRKVSVASPHFSDQILEADVGNPLPVESDDRMTGDIEQYVDCIAQSIGIRLPKGG